MKNKFTIFKSGSHMCRQELKLVMVNTSKCFIRWYARKSCSLTKKLLPEKNFISGLRLEQGFELGKGEWGLTQSLGRMYFLKDLSIRHPLFILLRPNEVEWNTIYKELYSWTKSIIFTWRIKKQVFFVQWPCSVWSGKLDVNTHVIIFNVVTV